VTNKDVKMTKRLFLFFFFGCCVGALFSRNKADSIIVEVLKYRDLYGEYIREYNAQVYIKGNTQVKKKNRLSKYAPDFLYWNKKGNNTFVESIVDVHFTAPNHFTQQIKALNGDRLNADDIQERLMQFLNVNIYNPTIFDDQVLLPGVKDAFRYYRFEYVGFVDTLGQTIHQIEVIPKIKSQKLISGYFYIVDESWTISRFDITGKWGLFDFRIETEFGWQQPDFLLPLNSAVTFHLNVLGNETVNRYFSRFAYQTIQKQDKKNRPEPVNYDLSNYFNIRTDSIPIIKDSLFWAKNRPVPLSPYEKSLLGNETTEQSSADSISLDRQLWNFSKGWVIPKKFAYNDTHFTYSGLLNPLKLAYSKLDGVLYWQQFKIHRHYTNGRELRFTPNLGILFQKQEVYFSTPTSWLFAPEKFGEIYFTFGNRNQSYNSTIIDQINQAVPDSIHFDDFDLEYYRHFQSNIEAKYELANGLLLYGGISSDWYIPVKEKKQGTLKSVSDDDIDDSDVLDIVQNQYRTFAPVIGLRWTPRQFYRINGKRKEYLNSRFPTFFVEYTRGLKGVLKSNSDYERIEIDVQQKIPLGLMRSVHYYAGTGWFTRTKAVYFADFDNFQRQNIPQSWNDPIGGMFHLLSGDWYNASNSYVQAHLMYESPFTLFRLFRHITTDIVSERLYVSQLYIPKKLPCYTEIGYGVGNFFGNAAVFISFNRGRYESVGTRFAFELGL
jgi:hypothetical protein